MHAGQRRFRQDLQLFHLFDVLPMHLCMTGMGRMEHIVKATEQLAVGFQHVLRKDAEHLLRQVILGNVEVIIQSGKRRTP